MAKLKADGGMKPDTLQLLFEDAISKALTENDLSEKEIERIAEKIPKVVRRVVGLASSAIYRTLRKNMPDMLQDHHDFLSHFEQRHYNLWKKGLDLLEAYLVLSFEVGESFNSNYRPEAAKAQDYLFEVLTRLHARSVHVGLEVFTLLSAGFADGAHARWRTAHEIAVVANFIKSCGQDTAKRYLEHEGIESYKAMLQFQDYARFLGYRRFSKKKVDALTLHYETLRKRYGRAFAGEYGWASEILGKENPRLRDIEQAAGLEHLRPYYKMASHNVHANPKGAKFSLGLAGGKNSLLAGPSNYGLTDPAHGISISILQTSIPILTMRVNIDSLVMAEILRTFVDEIGKALMAVELKMTQRQKRKK
jgi:Family of unknown function (DUF5677)